MEQEQEFVIEPDDLYKGRPVFDVDRDNFFSNMRKDWNSLKYPNDSKPMQFVKNSPRQSFYVRHTDNNGEQYLKKHQ